MPAKLAWTRDLPTRPGNYVWRSDAGMRIERIIESRIGLGYADQYGGWLLLCYWDEGGEWFGPLPE